MISILLASYGEQSQGYLDLCFESLERQTYKYFEVIHVSSGAFNPKSGATHHFHSDERLHFPSAIKEAYARSNKDFPYVMFLNDDVVMNKSCVEQMFKTLEVIPNLILNPMSNCDDNGRFYFSASTFNKLQYRIDELKEIYDTVIGYKHSFPYLLVFQPQVHFYCTMMTKKCYDDVGGIDPNYATGFDDKDFCLRAQQKGYIPTIAMHAYALHASGVSADLYLSKEDRDFNEKFFKEKFNL